MKKFLLAALLLAAGGLATAFAGGQGEASGLTVNGIPAEFNGRYALIFVVPEGASGASDFIMGIQGYDDSSTPIMALSRISNGTVHTPLHNMSWGRSWTWARPMEFIREGSIGRSRVGAQFEEYSGNDTGRAHLVIHDSPNLDLDELMNTLDEGGTGLMSTSFDVTFSNGTATVNLSN